ncbi:hypothetical protein RRG08_025087 [Elysia crispata]|uniref:Uncharacterized protein n=1 Tax=Elysia crispata TaxID=231223 RepID=A0AAE1AI89_9GAST|nr:hypothetical protein RRG08_025087 [Elysia crispata]
MKFIASMKQLLRHHNAKRSKTNVSVSDIGKCRETGLIHLIRPTTRQEPSPAAVRLFGVVRYCLRKSTRPFPASMKSKQSQRSVQGEPIVELIVTRVVDTQHPR